MLVIWNFLFRVGWERNGTTFFIFSISRPFPTYFGLKWSHIGIFWFFWISLSFFGIFYYQSDRKGTERQFLFFLFLGIFQPILAWNEAKLVFFLFFFSFFGILYFPSGRNGTERQFYFSLFLLLFQPILAWKEAIMGFFYFFFAIIFLLFFLIISYASGRNETKR